MKTLSLQFFYFLLLPVNVLGSGNVTSPTVDLGYAKYRGARNETLGIDTYYGIRFAAAPTGNLRWRPAVPIEKSKNYTASGTIDATVPGPQCIQSSNGDDPGAAAFIETLESAVPGLAAALGSQLYPYNSSEDCLVLNVVVPSKPVTSALPVIIGIHGGAYTTGNAGGIDGSALVSYAKGNVIHVAIQYRLGAYGFLGTDEVTKEGGANLGLLDQRVAMEWVQKHISKFGGDPAQVTIWGVSAGGGSTMNHLILNGAADKPPFRAAVSEFPWWAPYHDKPILEAQYQTLLNASNCSNLACLRSLPSDVLANATYATFTKITSPGGLCGTGDSCWGPYVDGTVISDLPSTLFKQGRFHRVPQIVDHDSFEGFFFQNYSINTTDAATADLQAVWPAATPSFFARLYQLYQLSAFSGSYFAQPFFSSALYRVISSAPFGANLRVEAADAPFWRMSQIFGDFIISCPTYYMASAAAAFPASQTSPAPIWKLICDAGIYVHGAIGVYLSAPNDASGNATMSAMLKDYYLSFVTELDPNKASTFSNVTRAAWPAWFGQGGNSTGFEVLQVEDSGIGSRADEDVSERCDFFHSQSYVVRN